MSQTLSDWLKANDLAEFEPILVENQVDMKVLEILTEADLKELGLPFGPRKRILNAIAERRGRSVAQRSQTEAPRVAASLGERRQLTVMFCDLVGSTALSASLDPEELNALIKAYRKTCSDAVARYEGYVAQYLGDGLLVYFGWPAAHEDAAERCVRSALEIVQAVQTINAAKPLAVRIGLATGPVVVGEASQGGSADAALAVGETPNLAARLQSLAGPGEIVIAASTRRLLGDTFSLTDLSEHTLKGFAEPIKLWRVDEARRTEGRFSANHGANLLSPLIGRDGEMTLLGRRWEQACSGEGQIILIGGQAGIGKSRLTQRLREYVTNRYRALHYQCSPYHLNSPLYPVIEHIELSAGFARADSTEQRLEKLEGTLTGGPVIVAEAAPLFAALLSLPAGRYPSLELSPQRQKEKTLEVLAGQVEALARKAPVLMVVEDAHWIDPTSQELLELLAPKVRSLPIMLVITHRLEYEPVWAGEPDVSILTLTRLERQQGAQLIDKVTRGVPLPPEVLDEILTRTDGVPLFVEELTRSVLESGLLREQGGQYVLQGPLTAFAIPVSLRDSLMARLDRLGPAKEFAQIGACIGREFSYDLLERISSVPADMLASSLTALVDTGLLTQLKTPPAATYTFKHALVQDAAYESLLKSRRHELHARIAQVIERDFADRVIKAPEWLAHHHTQAGHLAQAVPLWRKAGTLAAERVALKEAVAHFTRGLSLIDQLPPSSDRDALELTIREPLNGAWTGLHGWAAPEVGENATMILRLAESQGNRKSLLSAIWWVWTHTITQGRVADSFVWVERLLKEGEQTGDIDLRMIGHATAMIQHFLGGRLLESREHFDRVIELYDPMNAERWIEVTGHDIRTFVEVYGCQLMWMLGLPDEARALSERTVAHAHADGQPFGLVWALTFSSYVFAYRREPQPFLRQVDEADRLAQEQGLAFINEVSVPQARGIAELENGRPRQAISLLTQGIDRWTKTGGNIRVPLVKAALARALALDGDLEAAMNRIDECIEQINRPSGQERLWLAEVLRTKGLILILLKRDDEAEIQLRAAIECANQQHARSWELRCATTLASLMAKRGQRDTARELLLPVYAWFTEGVDTPDVMDARALLDSLTSQPLQSWATAAS
ncbi:MAG: adenylate/guanylate cyclase domain-containing protein [Acidobacteriaceae bacterium]